MYSSALIIGLGSPSGPYEWIAIGIFCRVVIWAANVVDVLKEFENVLVQCQCRRRPLSSVSGIERNSRPSPRTPSHNTFLSCNGLPIERFFIIMRTSNIGKILMIGKNFTVFRTFTVFFF